MPQISEESMKAANDAAITILKKKLTWTAPCLRGFEGTQCVKNREECEKHLLCMGAVEMAAKVVQTALDAAVKAEREATVEMIKHFLDDEKDTPARKLMQRILEEIAAAIRARDET